MGQTTKCKLSSQPITSSQGSRNSSAVAEREGELNPKGYRTAIKISNFALMDSILIQPKDENEHNYILELLQNIGALHKTISEEETEEFEMAMMMKASISTTGILRDEQEASILTKEQMNVLRRSELDIQEKLIITELKIQTEEAEWLKA
ncbi:hypothetical protein KO507_08730 [Gilvimarinus agarilyticus]|nr:hypothetical protein [Gilvimarinus agarilyticus]